MRVLGIVLILLGLLLCVSIVGAVIGIPLIFFGIVLVLVGGRRKTVITNVVQVSNTVPVAADAGAMRAPTNRVELDYDAMPLRSIPPPREAVGNARGGPSIAERLQHPGQADDSEFEDIEREISEASVAILRAAKSAGYDVRYRRDENRVVVSRPPEEGEMSLASNQAIFAFGRPRGYDR